MIKSAFQRVGSYVYYFPTGTLGRRVLWDGVIKNGRRFLDFIPPKIIESVNHNEMKVKLVNNSILQVVGTDAVINVGINPVGCIFSEYSLQDPKGWEYIRPILRENEGWSVFNFTPRGRNHAWELYEMAKNNPYWFTQKLSVDDTNILTPDDIAQERRDGMSEEMIQQEFYVSFDAGQIGSYYGRYITDMRREGRIGNVPIDDHHLVYTAWDVGCGGDSTAITFFQVVGLDIRIVDYYEATGYSLSHYVNILKEKRYNYGLCFIPHDARKIEFSSGMTAMEVLEQNGFKTDPVTMMTIEEGIEKARSIFPRVWLDENKCGQLLKCLLEYHSEYDETKRYYKRKPEKNWSSHGADSFRYMAISSDRATPHSSMTPNDIRSLRTQNGYNKVIPFSPHQQRFLGRRY